MTFTLYKKNSTKRIGCKGPDPEGHSVAKLAEDAGTWQL